MSDAAGRAGAGTAPASAATGRFVANRPRRLNAAAQRTTCAGRESGPCLRPAAPR
jgi:hypothetical protein